MEKKLKIAIIGYGRMGKEVEALAREQCHEPILIIDNASDWNRNGHLLAQADVAIEFTTPSQAPANIENCFQYGVPVVCGTTGWYDQLPQISKRCLDEGQSLFYAPNFSIGVNLFFEVNKKLASLMASFPSYQLHISETHHINKLDAPSGTAIRLANDILHIRPDMHSWAISENVSGPDEIPIEAVRTGQVPGTHQVGYCSAEDTIEIRHTAHNRRGFTAGCLAAAAWIVGKKGIFTMKDLLNI